MTKVELSQILKTCFQLKPKDLIINELTWKCLVRSVFRSKNVMLVGHSGTAKTKTAQCIAHALQRPFEKFNIGSTDDAQATLIGNTTYKKEIGTLFHPSAFVKAITTPNMVILLDELTRGSHSAWNILMPVIDSTQRYLRLDIEEKSSVIKVAEGVSFIATCNVGNEYTSTRVLDRAIARRFPIKLEMPVLNGEQLMQLFDILFPDKNKEESKMMKILSAISDDLIIQCKMEDSQISTYISSASFVEAAELIMDGFSIEEIGEIAIYTEYPDDGGGVGERAFIKSILQKYISKDVKSPINDPLRGKNKATF
jgi:MoxR-like ATPase